VPDREWAGVTPSTPRRRRGWWHGRSRSLIAFACAATLLGAASGVASAAAPGLAVIPRPSSELGLSYFRLQAAPGAQVRAGAVELQNPSSRRMRIVLSAVNGETLSTLGSGYAPPASPRRASTLWLNLGARQVALAPSARIRVPISVLVPSTVAPGDYLSGISIEALDQQRQGLAKKGVSIASVERYALGVEVVVPGPRHPLIQFTGASLQRQPAGLTFLLHARNSGNVILQGVHGHVRITRSGRTVLSQAIEPGTFVTGTRIAYPATAMSESASAGTRYQVHAWLAYHGGVARLDTTVTFGHRQALVQGRYAHAAPGSHGTTPWWELAAGAVVLLYAMFTTILLLRRKQGPLPAVQR
jgi:hypothetical protein